jgi:hypothetical protein
VLTEVSVITPTWFVFDTAMALSPFLPMATSPSKRRNMYLVEPTYVRA